MAGLSSGSAFLLDAWLFLLPGAANAPLPPRPDLALVLLVFGALGSSLSWSDAPASATTQS